VIILTLAPYEKEGQLAIMSNEAFADLLASTEKREGFIELLEGMDESIPDEKSWNIEYEAVVAHYLVTILGEGSVVRKDNVNGQ
jgi:hypothetical protein